MTARMNGSFFMFLDMIRKRLSYFPSKIELNSVLDLAWFSLFKVKTMPKFEVTTSQRFKSSVDQSL